MGAEASSQKSHHSVSSQELGGGGGGWWDDDEISSSSSGEDLQDLDSNGGHNVAPSRLNSGTETTHSHPLAIPSFVSPVPTRASLTHARQVMPTSVAGVRLPTEVLLRLGPRVYGLAHTPPASAPSTTAHAKSLKKIIPALRRKCPHVQEGDVMLVHVGPWIVQGLYASETFAMFQDNVLQFACDPEGVAPTRVPRSAPLRTLPVLG